MSQQMHLIYGTGPLGLAVMRALLKRGAAVRMVNRTGKHGADIPADVEILSGDAYDTAFTRIASSDAAVVYQCAQPAYQEWVEKFPPLQAAILDGAAANDAKFIVGENTYMYGDTGGRPLTEDLPYSATTRKGRVRAQMAESLLEAHREGKVRAASARGSDFFGPGVLGSVVGERVFGPAVHGKKAQFTGKLDLPHTFTFIEDLGEAMAILGERDEALGHAWHVPNDRPEITQREFGELIFRAAGQPPKMSGMGRMMMRVGGLFIPEARESVEMMYEFEKPFFVDSSRFEQEFGVRATPMAEAIRRTVDWYRSADL